MKVTKEEIEAKRTKNGGWTKADLAAWGVPWPPPKGWQKWLIAGSKEELDDVIIRRILDSVPKAPGG